MTKEVNSIGEEAALVLETPALLNRFRNWLTDAMCSLGERENTKMFSKYTNAYRHFTSYRITSIACWNVLRAFLRPDGICTNQYSSG